MPRPLFPLVACLCAFALAACPEPDPAPGGVAGDASAETIGDASGGDGTASPDTPAGPPPLSSGTIRRLSKVEIGNSLEVLTGTAPASLELIPPDSLGNTYDRVVNSQSMSRAHLDAFFEIATDVASTLIAEARLDDIAPECSDAILPPVEGETVATAIGASLTLGPEWAVQPADDPSHIDIIYAPTPTVSYSHTFEAPGTYTIELHMDVTNGPVDYTECRVGGTLVHTEGTMDGPHVLSFDVDIAAEGPQVLDFQIVTEPEFHNLAITFTEIRVIGPLDAGAVTYAADRRACAEALVDVLAPRAFRRPITSDERARLVGLYDQAEGATALRMVMQGILANPLFLYMVEVGEPVADAPGVLALNDFEVAQRLSYALCEQPPDAELQAAAAAGELQTPAQIEAQARRLMELPCARATMLRFYRHWLHLNHLHTLNKSPDAFPAWNLDVRDGLFDESTRFLDELFFAEEATLETLLSADYAWPDERSAFLSGMAAATDASVPMPPERRGVLTLPGFLAVTALFDATSPVERGVFMAEQILCAPIPPPPADLDVAPPPPDPNLTTKERWDQHSSDPACFGCHQLIDPLGFAFEKFDGVGAWRDTENGLPIDTTGGIPQIGIDDGTLDGAVELTTALSTSDKVQACLAKQYIRFALGRLEGGADVAATEAIATVLATESMKEGLVTLFTTEVFTRRYEPEAGEVSP